MEESINNPPPPYYAGSKVNPQIRQANSKDAEAISAIHNYYETYTDLHLSGASDAKGCEAAIKIVHEDYKLPYMVATVPLVQLSAEEKMRSEDETVQYTAGDGPDLQLTKSEIKAGERILGYALARPYEYPYRSNKMPFWYTAQLDMFIAPRYLHRGVEEKLVRYIVWHVQNYRWIPPKSRNLPTREAQLAVSKIRWKELLAIVPVSGSGDELEDEEDREGQRIREENQKKLWETLGFEERGRLRGIAKKRGKMLDIWYFQRHLLDLDFTNDSSSSSDSNSDDDAGSDP